MIVNCHQVWHLNQGKYLLTERLPKRAASVPAYFRRIVALLGPPPKDLLDRGRLKEQFAGDEGETEGMYQDSQTNGLQVISKKSTMSQGYSFKMK